MTEYTPRMTVSYNTFSRGKFAQHRKVTGAPVGADSSDLTTDTLDSWILNTLTWETILVSAVLTAPGAATVTIEWLFYDVDSDRFYRIAAATTTDLDGNKVVEIPTYQSRGVVRITGTTGNPTVVELRVAPGKASGMGM